VEPLGPPRIWAWLLALAGFLAGYCYLTAGELSGEALKFSKTTAFDLWSALAGVQTALWTVVGPIAVASFAQVWRLQGPRKPWSAVLSYVLLAAGLWLIPLLLTPDGQPIEPFSSRVEVLTLLGLVVASPGVIGMWSILSVLKNVGIRVKESAGDNWSSVHSLAVQDLVEVRGALQRLLAILGGIIAAAALTTAAFRNSVLALAKITNKPLDFPFEWVVGYGLFFTLMLALVYGPVYNSLERCGQQLLETRFPVPTDSDPSADWYSGRERLAGLLQLGVRPGESFKAGVSILAPLTASLLAVLLPS